MGWAKKQCSEGTIKDRRTRTRALPLIPMKTVRPKQAKKTTNTRTKWRLDSVYSRMGASLRSGAGARGQGPAGRRPSRNRHAPGRPARLQALAPAAGLLRNQGACLVRQSRPPRGPLQGGDTPGYPGSEGALPPRDAQGSHTHSSWQGKVLSTASTPTQGTFRPCHVSGGRSPPTHRPPPAARAEPEWQALSPARANVRLSLSCDSQAQPGNSGCHPHHAGHGARPPGQGPSRSEAPHLRRPTAAKLCPPCPAGWGSAASEQPAGGLL